MLATDFLDIQVQICMQTHDSTITLSDGTVIHFRRIRPSDISPLSQAFGRLSPRSLYLRFLAPISRLSDTQLRKIANVDFVDSVTLAAELCDVPEQPLAGIGQWVRGSSDPQVAELALTVVDEYQRRGVGLALLHRLAQLAEERGVHWFEAIVLAGNVAVRSGLNRLGAQQVGYDMGAYEFRISTRACSLRG